MPWLPDFIRLVTINYVLLNMAYVIDLIREKYQFLNISILSTDWQLFIIFISYSVLLKCKSEPIDFFSVEPSQSGNVLLFLLPTPSYTM